MHTFDVADMTCGRCAASITRAVQALDSSAQVTVDLARKRVAVAAPGLSAEAIGTAIALAGYAPLSVSEAPAEAIATRAGGCCCGGGASRRGGGCH